MDESPDARIQNDGHRRRELREVSTPELRFQNADIRKIAQKLTGRRTGTVAVSELIQ
jgi:hypothetical protein